MSIRTIARWRWVCLAWVIPVAGLIGLLALRDWEHAAITEVAERLKADPPKSLQDVQRILEGHPYIVGQEFRSRSVVGADQRDFEFKPNVVVWIAYTPRQKIVMDYGIFYDSSEGVDLNDIEGTSPSDVNWPLELLARAAVVAAWAGAWELTNWCFRKQSTSWRILGYAIATMCVVVLAIGYLIAGMLVLYLPEI